MNQLFLKKNRILKSFNSRFNKKSQTRLLYGLIFGILLFIILTGLTVSAFDFGELFGSDLITGGGSYLIPITSEHPSGEYIVYSKSGNESVYDVSFEKVADKVNICLFVNDTKKEVTNITSQIIEGVPTEVKETYNYTIPSALSVYKSTSLDTIENKDIAIKQTDLPITLVDKDEKVIDSKDIVTDFKIGDKLKFCYLADPKIDLYLKFGENSIIVIQQSKVSTDNQLTNVTAETNFTHLNISTISPYDKLVGYWNFDGDSANTKLTTAYDFSKLSSDGNYQGDALSNSTCGLYGNGLCLDGDGDYINGTITELYNQSKTITAWIYMAKRNRFNIFSIGDSFVDGTPQTLFGVYDAGGTSNDQLSVFGNVDYLECVQTMDLNTWYFVAFVDNRSDINNFGGYHLFVNGTECDYVAGTTHNYTDGYNTANNYYIGAGYNVLANGLIDEVMVFNTSLTSQQILNIYNNQSSRYLATGTQNIYNQSYMNISTGNNRVNVTTWIQNLKGSSVNLSVGYYDGTWSSTAPQVVTSGTIQTFTISGTSTNLTLNYTLIAGNSTNPFYSPIIEKNISYEVFNIAVGDVSYPLFSNYYDNNASIFSGGLALFNVTVANTNGTVWLSINGTNYSASNLTANVYNVSILGLNAGTYAYNWSAYGNGTSHLFNMSNQRSYSVNSSNYNYTYNISDSLIFITLNNRLGKLFKGISNYLSLSPIINRVYYLSKGVIDIINPYTFINRISNSFISLSDNINFSAFISRTSNLFRSILDTINLSDFLNRLLHPFRTATDSLTLSTSSSRTSYLFKTISNSLIVSDSLNRTYFGTRNMANNIIPSDSVSKSSSYIRTNTQSIGLISSLNRMYNSFRNSFQSILYSDNLNRFYSANRQSSVSIILTDNKIVKFSGNRNLFNSIVLTDSDNRIYFPTRTFNNNLEIDDASNRIYFGKRITTQSITYSDQISVYRTLIKQITQSISINDIASRASRFIKNPVDTILITLIIQSNSTVTTDYYTVDVNEILFYDELVNRLNRASRNTNDSINVISTSYTIKLFFRNIIENMKFKDFISRIKNILINPFDSFSFNTLVDKLSIFVRSILQSIGVSPYISITTNITDTTAPTFINLRNFTQEINTNFYQIITANDNVAIDHYWLNDSSFSINNGIITNLVTLSTPKLYWINISVNDTSNNIFSAVFYINMIYPSQEISSGSSNLDSKIVYNYDTEICELSLNIPRSNLTSEIYQRYGLKLDNVTLDNILNTCNKKNIGPVREVNTFMIFIFIFILIVLIILTYNKIVYILVKSHKVQ